jgi:phage terminase small subunit
MPDWKKIREEFETTPVTLQELADKYGISAGTVRSRKKREQWEKRNGVTSNGATGNVKKARQRKQRNRTKEFTIRPEDVSEELTEKQRLFCFYYIKNHNATQAALKAGYTERYPSEVGYGLLQKTAVRAEIERLKKIRNEAIMLTEEDIVLRNMQIAFADITDVAEWEVKETSIDIDADACAQIVKGERLKTHKYNTGVVIKASNQIDGGLIKEISQSKYGIKIKMEDRRKALDWLADYMLMNPMSKFKIEYDKAVLALREKELQAKAW